MKRFCVDNNSDLQRAVEAVRDLKRMVKLGRRAEKILTALQEEGRFDGKIPLVTKAVRDPYYNVVVHNFPAYEPISRDDIPDWDNLSIECGEREEGSHGGSKFWEMPVFLRGTALAMELKNDTGYTGRVVKVKMHVKQHRAKLGEARMKSNGTVTFDPNSRYANGRGVFRIKRNVEASDKTRQEAEAFAKVVARCLVNFSLEVSSYYGMQNQCKIPQKMLDLQAAASAWLLEDGHVKRFFKDILDVIEVCKIQEV